MPEENKIDPVDQPNPDGLTQVQNLNKLDDMAAQLAEIRAAVASTAAKAQEPLGQHSDWQTLYEAEREKNQRMEAVLKAGRLDPSTPRSDANARPALTDEKLRVMWGDLRYHKSSEAERITALGGDPSTLDIPLLKRLFGRRADGNDGREAQEMFKTNPGRYRQLKEFARTLRIL